MEICHLLLDSDFPNECQLITRQFLMVMYDRQNAVQSVLSVTVTTALLRGCMVFVSESMVIAVVVQISRLKHASNAYRMHYPRWQVRIVCTPVIVPLCGRWRCSRKMKSILRDKTINGSTDKRFTFSRKFRYLFFIKFKICIFFASCVLILRKILYI